MKIIAIDPGITSGYSIWDWQSHTDYGLLTAGVVGVPKTKQDELTEPMQLMYLLNSFVDIIIKHRIGLVAVEQPMAVSPQRIVKIQEKVAMLRYMVAHLKYERHYTGLWFNDIYMVNISAWKKVVCGKGNLKKAQVREVLKKEYKAYKDMQDTLDSIGVGIYTCKMLRKE